MNISKFTQKSVQAVQDLEKVAYEYGNQEIEQEHLLYSDAVQLLCGNEREIYTCPPSVCQTGAAMIQ